LNKSEEHRQPFKSPSGTWFISHNGTIANDKELLVEMGISNPPTPIDSWVIGAAIERWGFGEAIKKLKGSFAIVAINVHVTHRVYYATNYKPLYYCGYHDGRLILMSSQRDYLVTDNPLLNPSPVEVPPYTMGFLGRKGIVVDENLLPQTSGKTRTLVVCSGGLDSSTVAWKHHKDGDHVELFHILYGCKAEGPEVECVKKLAAAIGCKVHWVKTDFFTQAAPSSLTESNREIVKQGDQGAEFASEWVPARNTVMLALATAYAEAHNFQVVALGNNMEEAGAFPDNEYEFINRWNALAPYAVKPYHRLTFSNPCGNMVKHEIVAMGLRLRCPYELTWSCYQALPDGSPCGKCGPCVMRQRAFEMNGAADPYEYST
jgi:7-cyano-7-deazaguanine synthase